MKDITSNLRALSANDRSRTLAETQSLLDTATGDVSTITSIDSATAPLSVKFASLTLAMQATKLSDAPTLSKRQQLIAQAEAKAFMNALSPLSAISTEEDDEDPLDALQGVLNQSITIAEDYGRKATPITKETYTDCMVSLLT